MAGVYHDDYHASYDLTRAFLEKGRRKLGYIGAIRKDKAVGAERYRGFCDAVSDAGVGGLAENAVTAAFTAISGYEKAKELLERCGELDGLICATDTMAVGAVRYIRECGIPIPGEILVAGHGDSEMARVMEPPLITVHYSYEKSGEIAVRMLMEMLEHEEGAVREVKLGYHIVESEHDYLKS